jgi:hypothetical protein
LEDGKASNSLLRGQLDGALMCFKWCPPRDRQRPSY